MLPPIGSAWPDQGGILVGIRKLDDGDYAVIAPLDPAADIAPAKWKDAIAKAAAFKTAAHQDYVAADRFDLALCYMNAPQHFEKAWYWSATPYAGASSYAWVQSFYHGYQGYDRKVGEFRARAVRRVKI